MNIQPVGDYIVVRDVKRHDEQKTASGIILPSADKNNKAYFGVQGTVVGISEKCDEKLRKQIKLGDKVWYNKYESVPVVLEGVEYEAIHDHWIFARG